MRLHSDWSYIGQEFGCSIRDNFLMAVRSLDNPKAVTPFLLEVGNRRFGLFLHVEKGNVEVLAVTPQFLDHVIGQGIGIRLAGLVRGPDVIDRGESTPRIAHRQVALPQHTERLRTRHLVDEVSGDKQLGLAIGQLTHRVGVPNFFEQVAGFHEKRKSLAEKLFKMRLLKL